MVTPEDTHAKPHGLLLRVRHAGWLLARWYASNSALLSDQGRTGSCRVRQAWPAAPATILFETAHARSPFPAISGRAAIAPEVVGHRHRSRLASWRCWLVPARPLCCGWSRWWWSR